MFVKLSLTICAFQQNYLVWPGVHMLVIYMYSDEYIKNKNSGILSASHGSVWWLRIQVGVAQIWMINRRSFSIEARKNVIFLVSMVFICSSYIGIAASFFIKICTESVQGHRKVRGCGRSHHACLPIYWINRVSASNAWKATAKQAGKLKFFGFHGVHMLVIYRYSGEFFQKDLYRMCARA